MVYTVTLDNDANTLEKHKHVPGLCTVVYDLRGGASDRVCVTLSDVHIDIMDYLVPGACTEAEFRSMWSEFEWENKITINSNFGDLAELLRHLERATNMRCITPPKVI